MATYLRKWSTRQGEIAVVPLTFPELAEKFLKSKSNAPSPNTLRFYEFAIHRFVAWTEAHELRPEAFGPEQLEDFVADLKAEGQRPSNRRKSAGGRLAPSTVHAYARAVRSLLIFAAKRGHIAAAPILDMPSPGKSRPEFLTDEQIEKLLAACESPRDRALVSFMLDSALRRAEMCALTWGDLSWDGRLGRIRVLHGKGDKDRTAYFTEGTWRLMQSMNGKAHDPSESVWHLTRNGLRAVLDRLGERTGTRLHPHMFRHTAARRMLVRRMPVSAVQRVLGHSSAMLTLDLYGSFTDGMAEAAFTAAMG